jgi:apolipoprotein N-acyltransferase
MSTKLRLTLSLVSALLLTSGWVGAGALPLFVALVPLLLISAQYSASWRDALRMMGWALLTFVVWNVATVWWIWNATPIGPIAATVFSTWWSLAAFMLYHIISKHAPKGLAYIFFIVAWISGEYLYIEAPALSFPWLVLGNGFSNDTWAVQWYEITGVLGGSLWVLTVNVLAVQSLLTMRKRAWVVTTLALVAPMAASLVLYELYSPEREKYTSKNKVCISVVQPNVDCYEKFNTDAAWQQENLISLLHETPDSAQFVLMPETSLSAMLHEGHIASEPVVRRFADALAAHNSDAMLITGCETVRIYGTERGSETARRSGGTYYDIYNASIGIDSAAHALPVHHKGKLVVGVETIPAWLREGGIFAIDLGGTVGQLGIGKTARPFAHNDIRIAPAICYEGLYGNFLGEFVRNGAEVIGVVSNDGWWGDTPGYRYLFSFCRLRAIEHRRDIARSANTGISGFINMRGDDISKMGWNERGVQTTDLRTNHHLTFYTRHGDYLGRISLYIALLCLLYCVAYNAKKRFYLVD